MDQRQSEQRDQPERRGRKQPQKKAHECLPIPAACRQAPLASPFRNGTPRAGAAAPLTLGRADKVHENSPCGRGGSSQRGSYVRDEVELPVRAAPPGLALSTLGVRHNGIFSSLPPSWFCPVSRSIGRPEKRKAGLPRPFGGFNASPGEKTARVYERAMAFPSPEGDVYVFNGMAP